LLNPYLDANYGCSNKKLKKEHYLGLKKIYGNSNISPCKNKILKNPLKETKNPSRYYNSVTKFLKFQQKPKYHVSKSLI
jgi:hypothetical protein